MSTRKTSRDKSKPKRSQKALNKKKQVEEEEEQEKQTSQEARYTPDSPRYDDHEFELFIPSSNGAAHDGSHKRPRDTEIISQARNDEEDEEISPPLPKKARTTEVSSNGWRRKNSSSFSSVADENQSQPPSSPNRYVDDSDINNNNNNNAQSPYDESDFETHPFTQLTYGPHNDRVTSLRFEVTQERLQSLLRKSLAPMGENMMRMQELLLTRLPDQPNNRYLHTLFTSGPRVVDLLGDKGKNRSHPIIDWPVDQFYVLVYEAWYTYFWTLQEPAEYKLDFPSQYLPSYPARSTRFFDGEYVDMGTLIFRMSRIIELGNHQSYTEVEYLKFSSSKDHKAWDDRFEELEETLQSLNSKIEALVDLLDQMIKDLLEGRTKK